MYIYIYIYIYVYNIYTCVCIVCVCALCVCVYVELNMRPKNILFLRCHFFSTQRFKNQVKDQDLVTYLLFI